jgi:hypothetical protein
LGPPKIGREKTWVRKYLGAKQKRVWVRKQFRLKQKLVKPTNWGGEKYLGYEKTSF